RPAGARQAKEAHDRYRHRSPRREGWSRAATRRFVGDSDESDEGTLEDPIRRRDRRRSTRGASLPELRVSRLWHLDRRDDSATLLLQFAIRRVSTLLRSR